ncbi:hypothetical protein B0T20DRAFT_24280 [Sordaria brevicollis]|uniref:Uncharacterized protein n=1 Tax=Sordaria brevicollis TaxID=83679 RepID=A0AAE0PPM1_SORBR|nr:hypothetical protein B0T20DRAFT_24280 [Sordaria brevicollis]
MLVRKDTCRSSLKRIGQQSGKLPITLNSAHTAPYLRRTRRQHHHQTKGDHTKLLGDQFSMSLKYIRLITPSRRPFRILYLGFPIYTLFNIRSAWNHEVPCTRSAEAIFASKQKTHIILLVAFHQTLVYALESFNRCLYPDHSTETRKSVPTRICTEPQLLISPSRCGAGR